MGCLQSSESRELTARNRDVEKNLKKAKYDEIKIVRILLLGAGESGKTTIVKQMKILHLGGYNDEERSSFRPIIYSNVMSSMVNIIRAMDDLEIEYASDDIKNKTCQLMPMLLSDDPFKFMDLCTDIKEIWSDAGVKACIERRNEFQLQDSTHHYMSKLDDIMNPVFLPTDEDIIMARVKTSGIVETEFSARGLTIKLIDVGGQRSERKKWIHCFDNIQAILFITALSEYNLTLEEDSHTNRLRESIKLFESICNNKFFLQTSIIVFFNKKDIFMEKIEKFPFNQTFPEYEGPNNCESVTNYIQQIFKDQCRVPQKQIFFNITTATNTKNVEFVFDSVLQGLANTNLRDVGLL